MITDEDIKKMSRVFATKKDLEGFATKEDLKRFTTKEDLEGLVSREEFHEGMDSLRSDVLTKMDAVYKEVLDMRTEQSMHIGRHDRTDETLDKIKAVPIIAQALQK